MSITRQTSLAVAIGLAAIVTIPLTGLAAGKKSPEPEPPRVLAIQMGRRFMTMRSCSGVCRSRSGGGVRQGLK